MSTIVTRAGKGSPLTHTEVDANFTNLNADKVETSALSELIDDRVSALAVAGTNMTITYNDGAGTLTFDAAGGGGTPGGNSGEVQYNNGGAFAGAADVEIEGGQLRLPSIATPTAPAADGVKLFGASFGGRAMPAALYPSGVVSAFTQPVIGDGDFRFWIPTTGTGVSVMGWPTATTAGTATGATKGFGNRRTNIQRIEYLVTVAATTAVASWRMSSSGFAINGNSSWEGGFTGFMYGGPSTGQTNSSHRFFMGLGDTAAPSDVDPSTLLQIAGVGWDAADTELQFMHNDASGTATKVALGASFTKPSSDRSVMYRLRMFAPPGTSRSLNYEVTELESQVTATGTVTTDLPPVTSYVTPKMYTSVGGVSAVTGFAIGPVYFFTDPS